MKASTNQNTSLKRLGLGSAIAVLLWLSTVAPAWAEGNANPSVIPPQATPNGMSYGQWGAEWWKWVYAATYGEDPITDPDGRYGSARQSGEVWFLAGTFGQTVERKIEIPVGKKLFFPLVNIFNDYPCPDPAFEPGPDQTLEQFLTEGAMWYISHVIDMKAEVDGVSLQNLWAYRGTSPLTTFTGDPSWSAADPCITGDSQLGVSDGYWLMLAPLTPGEHTIHFTGTSYYPEWDTTWSLEVTYKITITPPGKGK